MLQIQRPIRFLFSILISNFLLSLHFALIIYINSSFLEQFFSPGALSLLFTLGAALNLFFLIKGPALINRFGNYHLALSFILLEFAAVLGLTFSFSPILIALLFIIHQGAIMTILFLFDIFLENYSGNSEEKTGGIRGIYLTLGNTAFVISPAIAGLILSDGDFWKIYLISSALLIPLFLLVKRGLKVKIEKQNTLGIFDTFKKVVGDKNLYGVFIAQFILQFFFAWMVIYMPIHLHQNLGFSWTQIGLIFTIMLLPFLLFEIPLGKIADAKLGEKEIMTIGFLIIALSSVLIPFMKESALILWALILFMTRVGASFVEISSESYFFKQVNDRNYDIISFFRISRPTALIIAPIAGAGVLYVFNIFDIAFGFLFLILALFMLCGIRYSLKIADTK